MGYAFISYSSKNQCSADALKNLFNNNGIDTWMAPGDIPAGSSYMKEINLALKNCSCLVLLLSEAAQNSQWVLKEVERAISYNKTIIPIRIEDMILNDDFEFALGSYHVVAIQKIDRNSEETKRILDSVAAATGTKIKEEIAAETPENGHGSFGIPSLLTVDDASVSSIKNQDEEKLLQSRFPQYSGIIGVSNGLFGRVYRATDRKSQKEVAIKVCDPFRIPFFFDGSLFWDIKKLPHENICEIIERYHSDPACLIMEYIPGKTLESFIKSLSIINNNTGDILRISLSILNGLRNLHEKNIFYGDLNPTNIIIDNDNVPWLCDFSESNYNGSRYIDKTFIVEKYRSPEKAPGKSIDYRSDIYEFGMILSDFIPHIMHDDNVRNVLFEVIEKSTRNDPQERYNSVDEIIGKLATLKTQLA